MLVPAYYTLEELHLLIQAVMGWDDEHLHLFIFGKKRYGAPEPDARPNQIDEGSTILFQVLRKAGAKGTYWYDFGDDWHHTVLLEKMIPRDPELTYPICTAGRRACPPEDCGGVYGYAHLLGVLSDSGHPLHAELSDMYGDELDPNAFSVDAVNRALGAFRDR